MLWLTDDRKQPGIPQQPGAANTVIDSCCFNLQPKHHTWLLTFSWMLYQWIEHTEHTSSSMLTELGAPSSSVWINQSTMPLVVTTFRILTVLALFTCTSLACEVDGVRIPLQTGHVSIFKCSKHCYYVTAVINDRVFAALEVMRHTL